MPDEKEIPAEMPKPARPATEPGNPNKPPEPKRQDDGQQNA